MRAGGNLPRETARSPPPWRPRPASPIREPASSSFSVPEREFPSRPPIGLSVLCDAPCSSSYGSGASEESGKALFLSGDAIVENEPPVSGDQPPAGAQEILET